MRGYEVDRVIYHGTAAVLYAHDAKGNEVAIAAEPRMARDIETAIEFGRRPMVDVEPWQLLWAAPPDDAA